MNIILEAVEILDKNFPNWRDKINLEKLDMNMIDRCILGQLYNNYYKGLSALNLSNNPPQGFGYLERNCNISDMLQISISNKELTKQWKQFLMDTKEVEYVVELSGKYYKKNDKFTSNLNDATRLNKADAVIVWDFNKFEGFYPKIMQIQVVTTVSEVTI